jgi:excisionase family DNA binding protein
VSDTEKDLLTVEEVARRLSIGRTTVYELMNGGDLRFIKIGRACRIPASEVTALIARKLEAAAHA